MNEPMLSSTRLVGGTSLALQLGHRKSTDLDLFTSEAPDIESITLLLNEKYGFKSHLITQKALIGFIGEVKVDVIFHPYRWLEEPIVDDSIRLATTSDIAAMKIHAIVNSGERPKDFVDIAYLSRQFSYHQLKTLTLRKYPLYDAVMIDRAMVYFDDVNPEAIEEIKMAGAKLDWEKIKFRILEMTAHPGQVFSSSPL